jgi:hypothetical protein
MKNSVASGSFLHPAGAKNSPDIAVFSIFNFLKQRLRAYFSIEAVQALGSTATFDIFLVHNPSVFVSCFLN